MSPFLPELLWPWCFIIAIGTLTKTQGPRTACPVFTGTNSPIAATHSPWEGAKDAGTWTGQPI